MEVGEQKVERVEDRVGSELKVFWKGFSEFSREWQKESDVRQIVAERLNKQGEQATEKKVETAVEALTLFAYGAKLAQELHAGVMKGNEMPQIIITNDDELAAVAYKPRFNVLNIKKPKVDFVIGMANLLTPQKFRTITNSWLRRERMSVSENIPDRSVVDLVLAGAEEYAHSLYLRKRVRSKEELSHKHQTIAESEQLRGAQGFRESIKLYHTVDVEYRALIWKQKILRKFFPSLAEHHKQFIDEVADLMHERNQLERATD